MKVSVWRVTSQHVSVCSHMTLAFQGGHSWTRKEWRADPLPLLPPCPPNKDEIRSKGPGGLLGPVLR